MPRQIAPAIARSRLAGFDRHYGLFRYNAQQAKSRFERADWHGIRRLARDRIAFYDQRVLEAVARIEADFGSANPGEEVWALVKRNFVTLLAEHRQPELAESFFNSVCTKLLHRNYYHNDFIFVRPAVATEYLDTETPSYRSYYPLSGGWLAAMRQVLIDMGFACPFVDVERDLGLIRAAARRHFGERRQIGVYREGAQHPQQGKQYGKCPLRGVPKFVGIGVHAAIGPRPCGRME